MKLNVYFLALVTVTEWGYATGQNCTVYSVNNTEDRIVTKLPLQKKDIWILPGGDFEVSFTIEVDNIFTLHPAYVLDQKLVITSAMVNSSDTWLNMQVRVDREKRTLSDYIRLDVFFFDQVHSVVFKYWWRNYYIKNAVIYVSGNVKLATECKPPEKVFETTPKPPEIIIETEDSTSKVKPNSLLIVVYIVVPTVMLIVVTISIVCLWKICRRKVKLQHVMMRKLAASSKECETGLMLPVKNTSTSDNIYEEVANNIHFTSPTLPTTCQHADDVECTTYWERKGSQWDFGRNDYLTPNGPCQYEEPKRSSKADSIYLDMSASHCSERSSVGKDDS